MSENATWQRVIGALGVVIGLGMLGVISIIRGGLTDRVLFIAVVYGTSGVILIVTSLALLTRGGTRGSRRWQLFIGAIAIVAMLNVLVLIGAWRS
ncbi:MAG: hypothetical protein ACTHQM_05610 [Thermoanaerobaculia bacterium]